AFGRVEDEPLLVRRDVDARDLPLAAGELTEPGTVGGDGVEVVVAVALAGEPDRPAVGDPADAAGAARPADPGVVVVGVDEGEGAGRGVEDVDPAVLVVVADGDDQPAAP